MKTNKTKPTTIAVRIVHGDALAVPGDALVLKHAQECYGADRAAAGIFHAAGERFPKPQAGKAVIARNPDGISALHTVVVGTPPSWEFRYEDVRQLSELSLAKLEEMHSVRHVVMTSHGVGFGLDPIGVFDAALAGLQSAVNAGRFPPLLRRISFATLSSEHLDVLRSRLRESLPGGLIRSGTRATRRVMPKDAPPDVLVSMPLEPASIMNSVFHSINKAVRGIRGSNLTCGTVMNLGPAMGPGTSVINRIHESIKSASYVIADITPDDRYGCSNPNVCEEVGYAWALGIDTVLIVRRGVEGIIATNFAGVIHIEYDGPKDLGRQIRRVITDGERKRGQKRGQSHS